LCLDWGLVRAIKPLWIALLLLPPVVAQAQFTFTTNNGGLTITGYTGPGGNVIIPSTTNGFPITSIGARAFYWGNETSVAIPDSVTSVEDSAFLNSTSLTNVTFGRGVASMGPRAFLGCGSLTTFTADVNNTNYSVLNGVLFDKSQNTLVIYPTGGAGGYVIPNTVTNIGNYAFNDCANLTGVTIPTNVTAIGVGAFYGAAKLTSIGIPASITNIGVAAFAVCSSLTAITVDAQNLFYSSVNGVLFNQNQTILCQYPSGLAGSYAIPANVTAIGDHAFDYCRGLTNITIGTNVTTIGNYAFFTGRLRSVTIPGSVTNIGDDAFTSCTTLTNAIIGNGVISIGSGAFSSCPNLTSITIPNSVITIGDNAFSSTGLKSATIPDSVATIGAGAFSATGLTNVTIPNSVTNIGDGAFRWCNHLIEITVSGQNSCYCSVDGVLFNKSQTCLVQYPPVRAGSYTIPASVSNIGSWAFNYCYGLASVTIPNGVTSIGDDAFIYCTSLTSVTIPKSVTSIGFMAFAYCSGLASVLFQGNAPSIGNYPFSSDGPIIYYLPGTTGWGWFLSEVGLPGALLTVPYPLISNNTPGFGVQTNQFGFTISWATNLSVVVEACTNLANPVWLPASTITLTSGTSYFIDPQWTNYPGRFYRLRSP
jgi:hypothetical protein